MVRASSNTSRCRCGYQPSAWMLYSDSSRQGRLARPSVARSQANCRTLYTYRDGGTQAVVGAYSQLLWFGDEHPPSAAWGRRPQRAT